MGIKGLGKVKAVQLKCLAELSVRIAKAQASPSLSFTIPLPSRPIIWRSSPLWNRRFSFC